MKSLPWPFTLPIDTLIETVCVLAFLAGLARAQPALALIVGTLILVFVIGI